MIRPEQLTDDRRIEAWLVFIEQTLLLACVYRQPHAGVRRVVVNGELPDDLVDAVDDHLKANGWRLYRRPVGWSGRLVEPPVRHRQGAAWFDVVEDKPCERHTFSEHCDSDHVPHCTFCGVKETEL